VDTDRPVPGPEPGVRNEPANLKMAVRAIGEIEGVSGKRVVGAVVANTRMLDGFRRRTFH
jgi:TatD DNase family protein